MNLLLFETQKGDAFPIGERDSDGNQEVRKNSGRIGQLKKIIHETYRKLFNKLPYHERLCTQLRNSSELRVMHSPGVDPSEAHRRLDHFMKLSISKHTLWTWINGIVAIPGIFLTPIPGPNVFFFYPAARSLGHYLARKGARRTLMLDTIHFQEEPLIDEVQNDLKMDPEKVSAALSELEQRYNLFDLDKLLKRLNKDERE
ncbi:MAG: hypothetical protein V3R94_00945 [Acidobacteriota bacterium]